MSKAPVLPDRAGIDALKAIISKRRKNIRFEMSSFKEDFCNANGECGTAYCIAGYATLVIESEPATATRVRGSIWSSEGSYHVKDLWKVLDPDGSRKRSAVFASAVHDLWSGIGLNLYRFDSLPLAQRRRSALAVLENFATTGKVDWQAVTPEAGHGWA